MTISAGVRCCPCSGLGFFIFQTDELSQTRGISRELFWSASTPDYKVPEQESYRMTTEM